MAPWSARTTTSGSSTASRASKSPLRDAARKASTTSRWRSTSVSGTVGSPWIRRRARLASWRAASGERSTIGAISSNGTAKMSWRTNARRSAGARVSSTTRRATPTESARRASCSGSVPSGRSRIRSGMWGPTGSSWRERRRPQDVERDPGDDRRQPGAEVLDVRRLRPVVADPRLLDGVVGFGERPQHAIRHGAQVRPLFLEALGLVVRVVHCWQPSRVRCHTQVTRPGRTV